MELLVFTADSAETGHAGDPPVTFHKRKTVDHFGLFTPHVGGQGVKIYLDDLKYSSTAAK